MPVVDKSGKSLVVDGKAVSVSDDYATESLNAAIREAGASTISWFKVNAGMNKKLGQEGVQRIDLTSDLYVPELISVAKQLGAKYIIRPSITNKSSSKSRETKMGFFSNTIIDTKSTIVSLKVDIIGVPEEEIIATKTFDGAVKEQSKISAFEQPAIVTERGQDEIYRAATNDAVVKATDFIANKSE